MANRYWVGGSGNWDISTGTHWSATSGGAGGAGVPTATDDVYFDANSNKTTNTSYTVTVRAAYPQLRNLNLANPSSGILTLTGGYSMEPYGGLTIATGVVFSYSAAMYFRGTGSYTITTNGVYIYCALCFNTAGTWTLQDDLYIASNLQFSLADTATFNANGKTVYLKFNTGNGLLLIGNWTFYNLVQLGGLNGTVGFRSTGSITVTNLLTLTGYSTVKSLLVKSNTAGVPITLTAHAVSLTNVTFQDIAGAGDAAPFTGTMVFLSTGVTGITASAYIFTYSANANGTISGTSPQYVAVGSSGSTVSAVPNSGFHLEAWSDSVTTADRTDTSSSSDITVSASFAITPTLGIYGISKISNVSTMKFG